MITDELLELIELSPTAKRMYYPLLESGWRFVENTDMPQLWGYCDKKYKEIGLLPVEKIEYATVACYFWTFVHEMAHAFQPTGLSLLMEEIEAEAVALRALLELDRRMLKNDGYVMNFLETSRNMKDWVLSVPGWVARIEGT